MKVAVITPYHSEPLDWIQAAGESVAAQSYPTTHILVGDGVRQKTLDGDGRIHMTLPHCFADSGGTPRAIAGSWAVGQGFDIVAYLDAKDRIDPGFVSALVRARERLGAEVISVPHAYFDLTMRPARNLMGQHIGVWSHGSARQIGGTRYTFMPASGMALAGGGLKYVEQWAAIPRMFRGVHDMIFSQAMISRPLTLAWLAQAKYHCRLTHRSQYDQYDLPFPPGRAAVPGHDEKDEGREEAIGFLSRLDEPQRRAFEAKFGIVAGRLPEQARIRELVSTAHARDGALKRDGAGWYEIVAPL